MSPTADPNADSKSTSQGRAYSDGSNVVCPARFGRVSPLPKRRCRIQMAQNLPESRGGRWVSSHMMVLYSEGPGCPGRKFTFNGYTHLHAQLCKATTGGCSLEPTARRADGHSLFSAERDKFTEAQIGWCVVTESIFRLLFQSSLCLPR